MDDPRVGYVIADYKTPELAMTAMASIRKRRPGSPIAYVDAYRRQLGYSAALNYGAKNIAACVDILCFLNADVLMVESDDQVLWRFQLHSDVGIIGPRQKDAAGRIAHGGVVAHEDGTDWDLDLRHRCWLWGPERAGVEELTRIDLDVPMVPGSVLYMRRDVYEQIGGWPEWTDFYYEDNFVCFSARARGWRVMYTGACTWIHYGEASPLPARERRQRMARAREAYIAACAAAHVPLRVWPDDSLDMAQAAGELL